MPTPFTKVRQGPIAADKIMCLSILGFLLMTRLPTALSPKAKARTDVETDA